MAVGTRELPGSYGAPSWRSPPTHIMQSEPGTTLSRDELQRFIAAGYLELPPSPAVPAEVHATIAAKVLGCGLQESGTHRTPYGLGMLNGDAAGNNLLHAAPELRGPALLESPELDGVLRSLLGPGYRMHPHCRGHLRRKGAQTQRPGFLPRGCSGVFERRESPYGCSCPERKKSPTP